MTPETRANATGFNWAAFLSGLWLPYRKIFRTASIFFGVILVEMFFEDIIYIGILGKSKVARVIRYIRQP